MFLHDYKVTYTREETIAEIAAKCLRAHNKIPPYGFDITQFAETTLRVLCQKKGSLRIHIFDRANKYDEPAHVTYRPPTLHIDRETWEAAKAGDDHARYIVAHEIGHLILHDHDAQSFSTDPSLRIRFAEQEYSAEWQANVFADHFLVPAEAVEKFRDEFLLSMMCNASMAVARRRLVRHFGHRYGALCDNCGNFALTNDGARLRCCMCGMTKNVSSHSS
jgi:Zn-dependent peptidase ImmA (M78 family)